AAQQDGANLQEVLREHLKTQLPAYMLPASVVIMRELPQTPNGKVDRAALPAPDVDRTEANAEHIGPRNPIEQTIAAIWSQLLGVRDPGIHDNFFELGGDSILSIQIMARARQARLGITPRQFFTHPTIAGLASVATQVADGQQEEGVLAGAVPLTPI